MKVHPSFHNSRFSQASFSLSAVTIFVLLSINVIPHAEAVRHKHSLKDKNQSIVLPNDTISLNLEPVQLPPAVVPQVSKSKSGKAKGRTSSRRSRDQDLSSSKSNSGKISPVVKSSWLAVANSMAQSDTIQQLPITDDSKPTKYHYYPHNQHLYLLPECATQQVCSAVYLRLNYSQPLCACPSKPCSVSTRTDDRHTIPLVTGQHSQVLTLVKTCEPANEVRECHKYKDWSILALQNSRTGKAHYLVICRCPSPGYLEGPIAHSQPAYARVPGIRVYGMTCVRQPERTGRDFSWIQPTTPPVTKVEAPRGSNPKFPWTRLKSLLKSAGFIS